jgi:hypothetical protein
MKIILPTEFVQDTMSRICITVCFAALDFGVTDLQKQILIDKDGRSKEGNLDK